jgi:hypothetical protein
MTEKTFRPGLFGEFLALVAMFATLYAWLVMGLAVGA